MALAVVALQWISAAYLNISISNTVLLFAFFGTLSCYNLIKYGVEVEKYREGDSIELKIVGILSIICLLASIYIIFGFQWQSWILLGVLLLMILLYILPIFPDEKNLRSLGIIKVLLVALIWTGMTVYLPVLEGNIPIDWDVLTLSAQRFLMVIALIIPFEIRDVHYDPPEIKTIPKRIGIIRTKLLGIFLIIITYMLVFLKDSIYSEEIYSRLWITLITILLIAGTPNKESKYYAAFWVESVPLIWLGVVYFYQVMS